MLSAEDARRIALAAAGFDRPRPARPGRAAVLATARRLGILQIDPINVLVPAQYLPLFSRLGPYARPHLEALLAKRALVEHWAHAASIVPVEDLPMVHRRNHDDARGYSFAGYRARNPRYCAKVIALVGKLGPVTVDEIPLPRGAPVKETWGWTHAKTALEAGVALGQLAVVGRRKGDRARIYDLASRVLPPVPALAPDEARRALIARSLAALGVATAHDLADYYRLPTREVRARLAELGHAPVAVEGWREPAYVDPAARARPIAARTLLSPFDPLVWFRDRALRLFGFDYRIEIYVPPAKRRWGYYVLPFLFGERLVARVDLRREDGALKVMATHLEPRAPRATRAALDDELGTLARWLGLAW